MISWGSFEKAAPNTSKNCQKITYLVEYVIELHDDSLQSYNRTDTFWKCSERKGCSKISKIQKKSLRNCPFFSNATAPQSRISDFSKYKLQEKCFLWVFWNSWNFAKERPIMTSLGQLNASKKISSYTFGKMLEKLLLRKFWRIIRKTSLVAFLLKNSICPVHPPLTIQKTGSTASVSFVCSESFQNYWESVCGGIKKQNQKQSISQFPPSFSGAIFFFFVKSENKFLLVNSM